MRLAGTARSTRLLAGVTGALACCLLSTPSTARVRLFEHEELSLDLGGYARLLAGGMLLPYGDIELPPQAALLGISKPPDQLGLVTSIARAEWKIGIGDDVVIDLHNRLYLQALSETDGAGTSTGMGIGVSPSPDRTLDLSATIINDDGVVLEHDIDRLAARLYFGPFDMTLGRQAITWGQSLLFRIGDVWTSYSPLDLDQSQKRGIDALRATAEPDEWVMVDFVIADRGEWEDISWGARSLFFLDSADVWAGAARLWDQLALMGGVAAEKDSFKLRAEALLAVDESSARIQRPRLTLGADWFQNDLLLTVEAHYNGLGAEPGSNYIGEKLSKQVLRGEQHLLGRWYLGGLASYKLLETLSVTATTMLNLADPSMLLTVALQYQLQEDLELSVGAFTSLGEKPHGVLSLFGLMTIEAESEFGLSGQMAYIQLAAFF